VRRCRSLAFTMIEALIAVTVGSILVIIMFEMFAKGTKTNAKATWRSHTIAIQRQCIRRIKSALEASSYPTVIRIGDYRELVSGYRLIFGDTASQVPITGTTLTSNTFSGADWALRFYRCHPLEDIEFVDDGSSGPSRVGTAAGYSLQLLPQPGHTDLFELWMDEATADITWDAGTSQPVLSDFGPHNRRRLVADVESLSFVLPTTDPGSFVASGSVVQVVLICKDPFDKRMRLQEACRVEVNIEMVFDPTAFEAGPDDPGF